MENNKQSLISEWFKKYVLMRDLKERSLEALKGYFRFFVGCTFWLSAIFMCAMVYSYLPDFSKLQEVDGILHTNGYVEKAGLTYKKPVMKLYVTAESQSFIYDEDTYKDSELYIHHTEIDGQKVKIWYLPSGNNFYLIKFINTNKFNDVREVKKSQQNLEMMSHLMKTKFPLYAMLSTFLIIVMQMLVIRYEIFRNYNLYFIEQKWNWKSPVKLNMTTRTILVMLIGGGGGLISNIFIIGYFYSMWLGMF